MDDTNKGFASLSQTDAKYIENTYKRFPVAIKHGKGATLYDFDGREYIDLGSGIAVNTFGAADTEWTAAVTEQAGLIQHMSNYYFTAPQIKLAELLCRRTGMERVFFSNSGAEANECAIKAARKYSSDKYGAGRSTIITLEDSFHGRTITTLSATGQDVFHRDFGPFTPGFEHIPPGDIAAARAALAREDVCAVMIELVQGESGVRELAPEYTAELAALAAERDIILITDEVQTGAGRTGRLFCFENYGIMPDIVTTAKGIGGGLPIGAALFGKKTAGVLTAGTHGSTFGGNPICAAGAYSIISRIDDKLLGEVREKGAYIRERLLATGAVDGVSGIGMMVGASPRRPAAEIVVEGNRRGILTLTAKDRLRLLPPLNITKAELARGMDILCEILTES